MDCSDRSLAIDDGTGLSSVSCKSVADAIVTGRRRGARILTLTFTRKHSMLIQHGGQHEPRAILFPTIPSVTTRGWGE